MAAGIADIERLPLKMIGHPPHASGAEQRCPIGQAQRRTHARSMTLAFLCTLIFAKGHNDDHISNERSFDIGEAHFAPNAMSNSSVSWTRHQSHLPNEVEQDLDASIATSAANGTSLDEIVNQIKLVPDLPSMLADSTKLVINEGVILANRLAKSMSPRLNITVFTYSKTLPVFHIESKNEYMIPLGRGEVRMKIVPDASFIVSPGPYQPFRFIKGDLGNTLPGDVGVFEFARGPPSATVITLTISFRRGKKLPNAHIAFFKSV